MQDLRDFVATAHRDTRPEIEPLPAIRPYEGFLYSASALADPFDIGNLRPEEVAASRGGGAGPDTNRRREPLEKFSLSGLQMVGTVTQKQNKWAVISAPDGTVHRIGVGNYIGQDYGKITNISDKGVEIMETVRAPGTGWVNRAVSLSLVE